MSHCGPEIKAPFIYFGGKSAIADAVWRRFGVVKHYVEPFFGSGAMLLKRPEWRHGVALAETANDADGLLANFWRALQHAPDAVVDAASWPINECDLHARHLWLVGQRESLTDRLIGDPDWYDAKAAGWWVWGASAWIGSGWCSGTGPWVSHEGRMIHRSQLPHMSGNQGVHRKLPEMASDRGVHRKLPEMASDRGVQAVLAPVAARMRYVKVACGDWARVLGPSTLGITGNPQSCAIFLDPPYDEGVGYTGGGGVSRDVWTWACEQGGNPLLRIAVCGYEDGREVPPGWRMLAWDANDRQRGGGYGNQSEDGEGRANARRERVWFSPACIPCEGDVDCATGEPVRVAGQQMGLGL